MAPTPFQIHELTDPSSALAWQAFRILQASFPPEEIETEEQIARRMLADQIPDGNHRSHTWAAVRDGRVTGVAIFSYYRDIRTGFLGYLAVDPHTRSQGLGSWLFQRSIEQLALDAVDLGDEKPMGMCLEVERPEAAQTDEEKQLRHRRIRFYRRLGAEIIEGVDFIGPPLKPDLPPVPYYLMFRPIDCPQGLSRDDLAAIVDAILQRGYDITPENPYYIAAIRSIASDRSLRNG
ncbi:MAG: GNAT family N-acetyltransferase [Chloroflexi bacterium]|nr:GNAT family N-acetyltransferase [Chloroflexota bacterium]